MTQAKLDRDKASVVTLTIQVVDINASPQQTGSGHYSCHLYGFLLADN